VIQFDLSVLFTSTNSVTSVDAKTQLANAEKNKTKGIAQEKQDPQVARDIAAFRKAVSTSKDASSFLSNPATLKVLLTANGLGDQAAYPALAKKALLSDPTNPASLASTLSNAAWKATAATYSFGTKGMAVVQDPKALDKLTDAYAEIRWRESMEAQSPGISRALSFRDSIGTATNALAILGDSTLRTVVTRALGIPEQIAFQSLDAQQKAINSKLDFTRLNDSKYVDGIAVRYLRARQSTDSSGDSSSLFQLAGKSRALSI
jgi:hypothetical protein